MGEPVSKKSLQAALARKWQQEQDAVKPKNKAEGYRLSSKLITVTD
ncbi:MerR family transcriptional regulator (fragment) [Hyella patelloides LEGE 07179]|uniref:MerR family transcriptional regulator n=1 Tax=Hyella patelloides LEGE 07179 TaxID=945734 RepID=A0A563VQW9_9CYAN